MTWTEAHEELICIFQESRLVAPETVLSAAWFLMAAQVAEDRPPDVIKQESFSGISAIYIFWNAPDGDWFERTIRIWANGQAEETHIVPNVGNSRTSLEWPPIPSIMTWLLSSRSALRACINTDTM